LGGLRLSGRAWQSAGICREKSSLENAISQVVSWQEDFAALSLSQLLLSLKPREFNHLSTSSSKFSTLGRQKINHYRPFSLVPRNDAG
jgi:aspartate oxidase